MTPSPLPAAQVPGIRTIDLTLPHADLLQRFFEHNPAYFLATSGEPPGPDEGREEITSELPSGWPFTRKWIFGYMDASGSLIAMANVVTDLLATNVFHIGTFVVATARHGTGDAQKLYQGLEKWSVANGARWMRLGVVSGNVRAQRFWASAGYFAVRQRDNIPYGQPHDHRDHHGQISLC